MKRWHRFLGWLLVSGLAVFVLGWSFLLYFLERTDPFTGTLLPTTVSVVEENCTQAIASARIHVQALMAERKIPGMEVAVAIDGKIVWSEGFGYADLEKKLPVSPTTQFRIASVSKLFTAAASMRLYEQGMLDLDAPIQMYVPAFPDKGHTITARQLLSHRAGIRHYWSDYEAINTKAYNSASESLEQFKDDPLLFEPDTEFEYSSYGFVLLSAVIEGISGEVFPTAVRKLVLEPLKMSNSIEERAQQPAACQSVWYDNETPYSTDGRMVISPYNDFSSKWAGGGFLSTAEDLVQFGSMHMEPINKSFLSNTSLDLMFTPRSHQAPLVGYGLGWMVAVDPHFRNVAFHFGAGSGGTSLVAIYPGERVAVAILANLGHAKFSPERLFGIVNPFLDDPSAYVLGGALFFIISAFVFMVRKRRNTGSRDPLIEKKK